jgi:hypothetical protein
VAIAAALQVGDRGQRGGRDVQQPVNQSLAAGAAARLAPVGQPGDGRAGGAEQADAHREGRGAPHAAVAVRARVQRERRRPGANRDVGKNRMQRMSEVDAVHRVLGERAALAGRLVEIPDGPA